MVRWKSGFLCLYLLDERGWSRAEKCPGKPMVFRKRVTTLHLAATVIRSCSRMILLAAAVISGLSPGATARRTAVSVLP
ncbi:MAG: hypothetical protein Q8L91_16245, partial [Polaromonas sp.]|nr:hypothetical protein [Polaromonas sp.]